MYLKFGAKVLFEWRLAKNLIEIPPKSHFDAVET